METDTSEIPNATVFPETTSAPLPLTPHPSGYSWAHIISASIVVTLIMLVIVAGNVLVIVAIATDRQVKGVQNWFIASLAVSDLCVGLLIMPFSLATELMGYWYFGGVMCDLWLATDVLLCTASILNLCLISLDRYWSITRAVAYVKQRTKKRAAVMISLVWLLSMILCFPPLAGWKRPQPQDGGFPMCELSAEPGYVVYSTVGSFYIPLAVMVLVYFKIYLAARARAWRNLKKPPKLNPEPAQSKSTSTSFSNTPKIEQGNAKLAVCCVEEELVSNVGEPVTDMTSIRIQTINVATSTSDMEVGKDDDDEDEDETMTHQRLASLTSADENRQLLSEDTDTEHDAREKSPGARTNSSNEIPSKNGTVNTDEEQENRQALLDSTATTPAASPALLNIPQLTVGRHNIHEGRTRGKKSHTEQKDSSPGRVFAKKQLSFRKNPPRNPSVNEAEQTRRKIARAKERRATIVLGVIMATFIGCWLPFFSTYLIISLAKWTIPHGVFATIFWLGYVNSALNPIIYTIFNQDFRQAFKKILITSITRKWNAY